MSRASLLLTFVEEWYPGWLLNGRLYSAVVLQSSAASAFPFPLLPVCSLHLLPSSLFQPPLAVRMFPQRRPSLKAEPPWSVAVSPLQAIEPIPRLLRGQRSGGHGQHDSHGRHQPGAGEWAYTRDAGLLDACVSLIAVILPCALLRFFVNRRCPRSKPPTSPQASSSCSSSTALLTSCALLTATRALLMRGPTRSTSGSSTLRKPRD